MLSAASCTPGTVQYMRVCPRFPLPDSFPPGRLSWDGDWQKNKKKAAGGGRGGYRGGGGASYNQKLLGSAERSTSAAPRPCLDRASSCAPRAAVQMKRSERQHLHRRDRFVFFFLKSKGDSNPPSCVTYLIYMFHIYSVSQQWQSRTQS